MNKIALVAVWNTYNGTMGIQDDDKFLLESMFSSAKKYFLKEKKVDFILITNDVNVEINGIKKIKIDYDVHGYYHILLMKIISLKFLNDDYDMIFVVDHDSVFINDVGNEILNKDFYILDHFYKPTIKSIHEIVTTHVPLNFDTTKDCWTMGNFFGAKKDTIRDLINFVETQHKIYVNCEYNSEIHFYAKYPDELFLIKYIFENNINHERLTSSPSPLKKEFFLSSFDEYNINDENYKNVKLLHDTKKHLNKLKEIINYI